MEEQNADNTYPLDEAMVQMVEEHMRQTMMMRGALSLFCRQHNLKGIWDIAPNGKEIVRIQQQPVIQQQQ